MVLGAVLDRRKTMLYHRRLLLRIVVVLTIKVKIKAIRK
jgi:hypothetical protein